MQHSDTRVIGLLLYDDVQALDLTGSLDAFGIANHEAGEQARPPPHELVTIGVQSSVAVSEAGLRLVPEHSLSDAPPLDTLVMPGAAAAAVSGRMTNSQWMATATAPTVVPPASPRSRASEAWM